uniref:Uncharacterized protein LOC111124974 isoform X2 n=1 Tax=Crassostrea virginica TaxID=6565 RepID=A0A8B8D7F0_CRAVI|nr:uncharacterized protein LOC111124974 isoform X2 [Crassostrea virginica]
MQLVSAFDNSSVYFYPISAQQATRMRCLGIVMVILAISEDALSWFGFPPPCHSNEECSNNWLCPSEGHCTGHYPFKHCECLEHNNHVHGTTTTTSTTPTSTATTTTTQPLLPLRCSNHKISIIESLAENIHVEDDRVAACPGTQKHQSSEALVIQKCNATTRDFWVPGPKTVQVLCSERAIEAFVLHRRD